MFVYLIITILQALYIWINSVENKSKSMTMARNRCISFVQRHLDCMDLYSKISVMFMIIWGNRAIGMKLWKIVKYFFFSENSVGSESLIKGDVGNESKKNEKVTTKSVSYFFPH